MPSKRCPHLEQTLTPEEALRKALSVPPPARDPKPPVKASKRKVAPVKKARKKGYGTSEGEGD